MELNPEFYLDLERLLDEHPMSDSEAPGDDLVQAYIRFARRWSTEVSQSIAAISYAVAGVDPRERLTIRNPWMPKLVTRVWPRARARFEGLPALAEVLAKGIQQDTDPRLAQGLSIAGVLLSGREGTSMQVGEAKAMADLAAWKAHTFVSAAAA